MQAKYSDEKEERREKKERYSSITRHLVLLKLGSLTIWSCGRVQGKKGKTCKLGIIKIDGTREKWDSR